MKRRVRVIVWSVALILGPISAASAICWGSLSSMLVAQSLTGGCPNPIPSLTKSYQITCRDDCGEVVSIAVYGIVGWGACGGYESHCDPNARTICLPTAGVEIYGYNPPSFHTSIINKAFEYPIGNDCFGLQCVNSFSSTLSVYCSCYPGSTRPTYEECYGSKSPILLSLGDQRFELTDRDGGVYFDLNADGEAERIPWTAVASDEAFLALDRDGDGAITDGTELFGDVTPQSPSEGPNGFLALAMYDDALSGGNEDGRITAADEIFADLLLWYDANHNGVSEPGELQTIAEEVEWIDLDYGVTHRVDRFGNQFKNWARYGRTRGGDSIMWDVFFLLEDGE